MATLSGKSLFNTYKELLKLDNSTGNTGITGSLQKVEDGDGVDTALELSSAGVKSSGTFEATGNTILGGTLSVTGASTLTGNTTVGGTLGVTGNTTLTGTLGIQAGTAASPAIAPSSDTNTGIFFPAADTIAFAEGGAEAMRIDSSGNVGIGTTSPSSRLAVSSASAAQYASFNSNAANGGYLTFESSSTVHGDIGTAAQVVSGGSASDFGINARGSRNLVIGTNNTERLRIDSSGNVGIGLTSPSVKFEVSGQAKTREFLVNNSSGTLTGYMGGYYGWVGSGSNTDLAIGAYGSNMTFFTNGSSTERLRIDSSGNVGIGTTSPATRLHVTGTAPVLTIDGTGITSADIQFKTNTLDRFKIGTPSASDALAFYSAGSTERLRIDSSGNVGVGTASPSTKLTISGVNTPARGQLSVVGAGDDSRITLYRDSTFTAAFGAGSSDSYIGTESNTPFRILTNATERLRIDSSGNVLIGTTTSNFGVSGRGVLELNGTDSSLIDLKRSNGSHFYLTNNSTAGYMWNEANTPLIFATNATERLRITSGGDLLVGKTSANTSTVGFQFIVADNKLAVGASSSPAAFFNRNTDDGVIVQISQDGTQEGTISVSGTTVSYNGGHLSRWSQLLSGQRDESIKKGTVLSNLDEMCVWNDAEGNPLPNEQLNKVKVSDVEGDGNVAGLFVNWDNDDQDNPFDLNMAMTGDMIIRIAQGVTVNRGDLLMSAGDGTAKPQGDDILRSKTIAKVTSTSVTCTYEDGSYCVPCVIMAC